jgi:hypothetical protein
MQASKWGDCLAAVVACDVTGAAWSHQQSGNVLTDAKADGTVISAREGHKP